MPQFVIERNNRERIQEINEEQVQERRPIVDSNIDPNTERISISISYANNARRVTR